MLLDHNDVINNQQSLQPRPLFCASTCSILLIYLLRNFYTSACVPRQVDLLLARFYYNNMCVLVAILQAKPRSLSPTVAICVAYFVGSLPFSSPSILQVYWRCLFMGKRKRVHLNRDHPLKSKTTPPPFFTMMSSLRMRHDVMHYIPSNNLPHVI